MVVEVRALNSKQLDINLKLPSMLRELEPSMRKSIQSTAIRGKTEVAFSLEGGAEKAAGIDEALAEIYHQRLTSLADRLSIDTTDGDLLTLITRMPEVLQSPKQTLKEGTLQAYTEVLEEALQRLDEYRKEEGISLHDDLLDHVSNIAQLRADLPQYIDVRIERIRDRIRKNLDAYLEGKDIDENRFEQELLFYLEKYDVSEEMTRLDANCAHFKEALSEPREKGKKLGFISQEMGREINTLGAKAYDARMQRIVVQMKDELEKIKEQVLNVL